MRVSIHRPLKVNRVTERAVACSRSGDDFFQLTIRKAGHDLERFWHRGANNTVMGQYAHQTLAADSQFRYPVRSRIDDEFVGCYLTAHEQVAQAEAGVNDN